MSDNKTTPTENQEADSFVGRLSLVFIYLASIASGLAGIALSMPSPGSTHHKFFDNLFGISILGWPAYIVVIYLCGRFNEVSKRCLPGAGSKGDVFYVLCLIPFAVGISVAAISWLMWRLPNGIIWVGELFRG